MNNKTNKSIFDAYVQNILEAFTLPYPNPKNKAEAAANSEAMRKAGIPSYATGVKGTQMQRSDIDLNMIPKEVLPKPPSDNNTSTQGYNSYDPTQQQKDAFKKMHGTSFDPNSSMDRRKMAQMTGQAAVSTSIPGAGQKPGQPKNSTQPAPAVTARPGATQKPGVSQTIGNVGNTIETGVGKAVQTAGNILKGTTNLNPTAPKSSLPGALGTASSALGGLGNILTGKKAKPATTVQAPTSKAKPATTVQATK